MLKYSNLKIRAKLMFIYLVTCFIPMLLISFFLTAMLVRFSSNDTMNIAYSGFSQLKSNIVRKLDSINTYIDEMSTDSVLLGYMSRDFENDYNALLNYTNVIEIRSMQNLRSEGSFLIYSENKSLGISRMTNNNLEDFYHKYSYSTFSIGKTTWLQISGLPIYQKKIGCFKAINGLNAHSGSLMIFAFEIQEATFQAFFDGLFASYQVFLVNENNDVISSTDEKMVFQNISRLTIDNGKSLVDVTNGDTVFMNGLEYYIFSEGLNDKIDIRYNHVPNWSLLYMIPFNTIQKKLDILWLTYISIALLCAIFSLFAASRMSNNITSRLSLLVRKTWDVQNGNLDIAIPVTSTDEIGILESGMYEMVFHIEKMMKDISETHKKMIENVRNTQKLQGEKKQAELIALRSQINPHYLFNTLESIRMNLILKGDHDTADIVKTFAETFRMVIDSDTKEYTVNDEITFVDYYLKIQKYRFGDKLNVEINIPEHIRKYPIPKLIIQPLIENSIYHGIERKLGPGKINLFIDEDKDIIHIKVKDDGVGIDPEMLRNIKHCLETGQSDGTKYLALVNIAIRLRLLYGATAGMEINSSNSIGTTVQIYLPKNESEGIDHIKSIDCR